MLRLNLSILLLTLPLSLKSQSIELVHRLSEYTSLNKAGNLAYYITRSRRVGDILWCTNGEKGGNRPIIDTARYTGKNRISLVHTINEGIYFSREDGATATSLWWSNGTTEGTYAIRSDSSLVIAITSTAVLTEIGELFFSGHDKKHGAELRKVDSDRKRISLVKDINLGKGGAVNSSPVYLNNLIFFVANDGHNGYELWRSDGTEKGTFMVKDVNAGVSVDDKQTLLIPVETKEDSPLFAEKTIRPEVKTDGANPLWMIAYKNKVFFSADDGQHGRELWCSDGTKEGTRLFQDFLLGKGSGNPEYLFVENNWLYFYAKKDIHSSGSLYRSDGTVEGTVAINEFVPEGSGRPNEPTHYRIGDVIYYKKIYIIDSLYNGSTFWRTDGTTAGTRIIKLFDDPDSYPQVSRFLGNIGPVLYFSAYTKKYGTELWRTDGTDKGTFMVWDSKNWQGGSPISLVELNQKWFFVALDEQGPGVWLLKP